MKMIVAIIQPDKLNQVKTDALTSKKDCSITFGTSGWRAQIGEEYSIYNRQDLINILRNYTEDAIMNNEEGYALGPANEIINNNEYDY